MQKWLLPQMTKMRTTCSKERRFLPSFFRYKTLKNGLSSVSKGEKVSKCCPNVAKIRSCRKRKSPKSLFYNNLGVILRGAQRTAKMIWVETHRDLPYYPTSSTHQISTPYKSYQISPLPKRPNQLSKSSPNVAPILKCLKCNTKTLKSYKYAYT